MRPFCSRGSERTLAAVGAVCLLAGALTTQASDWARWRGPDGTGISAEKGWRPQALAAAKIQWKASLGKGHSSLAVVDKHLYAMGNPGNTDVVYCLDSGTGKEIWKYPY